MVEGAAAHIASEELDRSGLQFPVPSGEVSDPAVSLKCVSFHFRPHSAFGKD